MTEKKTFKNPLIEMELDGSCYVVTHSEGLGSPYGQFHSDEWDMEVTFTKKVKPFKQDDQVILLGGGEFAIIQWIIDDLAWVNVVASANGAYRDSHHVVKLSELKHVS
jgi:hypothetical protein